MRLATESRAPALLAITDRTLFVLPLPATVERVEAPPGNLATPLVLDVRGQRVVPQVLFPHAPTRFLLKDMSYSF